MGNRWRDQAQLTGFRHRDDDLERLAALGTRRVRLPVLWEHVKPEIGQFDFAWPDRALARLRKLGMTAIVGLLHHVSAPARTQLLDERFPQLLPSTRPHRPTLSGSEGVDADQRAFDDGPLFLPLRCVVSAPRRRPQLHAGAAQRRSVLESMWR